MKVIFSRKGFDSGSGKVPSPIFDNNIFFSLPIPSENEGSMPFSEINYFGYNIGDIVQDLTKGKLRAENKCHFDPDLHQDSIKRIDGWKPLFGQSGAAQGHLRNRKINIGDLFIFYGWFNNVITQNGIHKYDKATDGFHTIFGWLQIGDIISVYDKSKIPKWASYHPHFSRQPTNINDVVYIATEKLILFNQETDLSGAGILHNFEKKLILTHSNRNRSIWNLPTFFYPHFDKKPMSYHEDISRWKIENNRCILNTVSRGQEFVIDCNYYPELTNWLLTILTP